MRKPVAVLAGVAMLLLGGLRADAGTVSLSLHDGLVTLTAQDVPLREVIGAWQKTGQTVFVNADRLAGPPVTLQLTNVPERQALDLILQSAAGYMAAPRTTYVPGASVYRLIFVLATSTPPPPMPARPAERPTGPFFPNPNGPQGIPIFRPRFPRPNTARPNEGDGNGQNGQSSTTQPPPPSAVITAPVIAPQPGVVVVPPKKPGGGGN